MSKEEILKELSEIREEMRVEEEKMHAVHLKYNAMAELEYPTKDYVAKYREMSAKRLNLEKQLSREEKNKAFRAALIERARAKQSKSDDEIRYEKSRDMIPSKDELARELQERLVQCCIEFILEKGDMDISEVRFSADSLQESADNGEWTCSTDSSISLYGYVWNDETKSNDRAKIGEYI